MLKSFLLYTILLKTIFFYFIENSIDIIETSKVFFKPSGEISINFLLKTKLIIDEKQQKLTLKLKFPFEINSSFYLYFEILDNDQNCFEKKLFNPSLCTGDVLDIKKTFFCEIQSENLSNEIYIRIIIYVSDYLLAEQGFLKNLFIAIVKDKEKSNSMVLAENNNFFPFFVADNLTYAKTVIEDIDIMETFQNNKSEMINQNFPLILKLIKGKNVKRFHFELKDKNSANIKETSLEERLDFRKMYFYRFSDDAESTCEILVKKTSIDIVSISKENFNCFFEDFRQTSIFVVFKSTKEIEKYENIYFKIKVKSPAIPSLVDLFVSILYNNVNIFIDTQLLENALVSNPLTFVQEYPRLIISSNYDTSNSQDFPILNLFATSQNLPNFIAANHIKFVFKLVFPLSSVHEGCYYSIKIRVNFNNKSKILTNYFYHNLPIIYRYKDVEVVEESNGTFLIINFVDALENDMEYFFGFRVILDGSENLNFDNGSDSFGNMKIVLKQSISLLEADVVEQRNLFNLSSDFKQIKLQNNLPVFNTNTFTIFHTLPSNAISTDFVKIHTSNFAGLIYDNNAQFFFLSTNFRPVNFFVDQTVLEFILPKSIKLSNINFTPSIGVGSNCLGFVRNHLGSLLDEIERCYFLADNLCNRVFLTFKSVNAFSNLSTRDFYIGFFPVVVDVRHSFYGEDESFKILDGFIKIYEKVIIEKFQDLKQNQIKITPDYQFFSNMFVKDNNSDQQFQNLSFTFENYYENTGYVNFPEKIPVLLRIANTLPNIDLRMSQKIILYYNSSEFEFLDKSSSQINLTTSHIESSCSTKTNTSLLNSSCIRHKGISSYNCGANTCYSMHYLSRLEIELPTEIFTYSSTKPFQILLPVVITGNIITKIMLATSKTSSLSSSQSLNNVLSYTLLNKISKPSNYLTNISSVFLNNAFLTSNIFYKPGAVFFNVLGTFLGETSKNSNIELHCKETFCKPALVSDEYYSFTFCFDFEFIGEDFFINNEKSSQHQLCVFNIEFEILGKSRFCAFCPLFMQGQESLLFEMKNFYVNPENLKGTDFSDESFVAISGKYNTQGLYRITRLDLTNKKFSDPNFINSFEIVPQKFINNLKNNIFILLKISTVFYLKKDQAIIIKTDNPNGLPFTEGKCDVIQNNYESFSCEFKKIDDKRYYITIAKNLDKLDFEVKIFGVDLIEAKIGPSPYSLELNLDIVSGAVDNLSNDKRIIMKTNESFIIVFEDNAKQMNIIVDDFLIKSKTNKIRNKFCVKIKIDFVEQKMFNSEEYFVLDFSGMILEFILMKNIFCRIYNENFQYFSSFVICDVSLFPKIKFILGKNELKLSSFYFCISNIILKEITDTSFFKVQIFNSKNDFKIAESQEYKIKQKIDSIFPQEEKTPLEVIESKITKKNDFYGLFTNIYFELKIKEKVTFTKILLQLDPCHILTNSLNCYQNYNSTLIELPCSFYDDNNIEITEYQILKEEETYFFEIHNVMNCLSNSVNEKYYLGIFEKSGFIADTKFIFYSNFETEIYFSNQISTKITRPLVIINSISFFNNIVLENNTVVFEIESNILITDEFIIEILFFYDFEDYGIFCSIFDIQENNLIEKCQKINRNIVINLKKESSIATKKFLLTIKNIGNSFDELCRLQSPEIKFLKNNIIESFNSNSLLQVNFDGFFQEKNKNSFYWENPLKYIPHILNIAELNSKNLFNNFFQYQIKNNQLIDIKNLKKDFEEEFGVQKKKLFYTISEEEKVNFEIKKVSLTPLVLINSKKYSLLHKMLITYLSKKFTLLIGEELINGNFYEIDSPYDFDYSLLSTKKILFDKKNFFGVSDILFSLPFNLTDTNLEFEIFLDPLTGVESSSKIIPFSIFRNSFSISFTVFDIEAFKGFIESKLPLMSTVKYIPKSPDDYLKKYFFDKKISFEIFDSVQTKQTFTESICSVNIGTILENSVLIDYQCFQIMKIYYYIMPSRFFKNFKFSKLSTFLSEFPFQKFDNLIFFGYFTPLEKLADKNINFMLINNPLFSNYEYTVKFFIEQNNLRTNELIYNFSTLKSTNSNFTLDLTFNKNLDVANKSRILCMLSHKFSYPTQFIQDEEGNKCIIDFYIKEDNENSVSEKIKKSYPLEILDVSEIKNDKNNVKTVSNYTWKILFEEIRTKNDNNSVFSKVQKSNKEVLKNEIGVLISEKIFLDINLLKISNPIYYNTKEIVLSPDLNLYYIPNTNSFFINQLQLSQPGYLNYIVFNITQEEKENVLENFLNQNYNYLIFLQIQQNLEINYFFSEKLLNLLNTIFPIPGNFVTFSKFEVLEDKEYYLDNPNLKTLLPGHKYLWVFLGEDKRNFYFTSEVSKLIFKTITVPLLEIISHFQILLPLVFVFTLVVL